MQNAGTDIATLNRQTNASPVQIPDLHEISLATVATILVEKGICTPDELFTLEGRLREQRSAFGDGVLINVRRTTSDNNHLFLKRIMRKYRWSRRLGTALFGWKWKKVKKDLTQELL